MKKYIIFLWLLAVTYSAQSQTVPDFVRSKQVGNQNVIDARLKVDKSFILPVSTEYTLNGAKNLAGHLIYNSLAGKMALYDGLSWNPFNIIDWNSAYGWGNHAGLYKPLAYVPTWSEITAKPTLSTVSATGDYNDLLNLPSLSIANWNTAYGWGNHAGLYKPLAYTPSWSEITAKPTFATVATSGDYNDLTNLPLLNLLNWNTAYGWGNHAGLYKPLAYTPSWSEITAKPTFATVATSGDYNDLSNLPLLNLLNWNTAYGWGNHAGLYKPVAYTPSWSEITAKPTFASVATTGDYNDLINKPVGGSSVDTSLFVAKSGNQTITGQILFNSVPDNRSVLIKDDVRVFANNIPDLYTEYKSNSIYFNHSNGFSTTVGFVPPTSYNGITFPDLSGTVAITSQLPTGTDLTNWNTAYGWGNHAGLYKPAAYVPSWSEITAKPTFATVSTSGDYNDLINKPLIPLASDFVKTTTDQIITGEKIIKNLSSDNYGTLLRGDRIAVYNDDYSYKTEMNEFGFRNIQPTGYTTVAFSSSSTNPIISFPDKSGTVQLLPSGVQPSGTYTPAVTAIANCTVVSATKAHYTFVGSELHIQGEITVNADSGSPGTYTEVEFNLPSGFTGAFSSYTDAVGQGVTVDPTVAPPARLDAQTINGKIKLYYYANGISMAKFRYTVLASIDLSLL